MSVQFLRKLSEIGHKLPVINIIPWSYLHSASSSAVPELYGHLASLPPEEPPESETYALPNEEDARREIRNRLTHYFGKLKMMHDFVRDITVLCAWWRLDATDSPTYADFRTHAEKVAESSPVFRISQEFLEGSTVFEMTQKNIFSETTESNIDIGHKRALMLMKEEIEWASAHQAFQHRALKNFEHPASEQIFAS